MIERIPLLLSEIRRRDQSPRALDLIRDQNFPKQDAFVMDASRFVSAFCTRRAGKSNGLAIRYYRTLKRHPGALCPYIALTRDSAKNIMWDVLQEMDERFKIGAKFTESDLTATLPCGGRIKLFGADMKNFIKRLRGIKTPGVGVDEAQDFGAHLIYLIDDVLTPAIGDYVDGWIALTGTPGPIPHGYFYEVTHEGLYGFSQYSWSIHDNPYFPNSRQFVAEIKAKKKWTNESPTYIREYGGDEGIPRWVLDLDALVFKFTERNHYNSLPAHKGEWNYVIGVDFGFDDADAIAVIGWHPHHKDAYLVEEFVQRGQGITDLAGEIQRLMEKYKPMKIVADTGALGKKIADELTKRFSLPIDAAEKDRKFEFIELLNDALRMAKFYAKPDSTFADDCKRVKWDTESVKPKISDTFHSDICDAVLYAYREALHWLSVPEPPRHQPGSDAAMQQEEDEMEKQAEQDYLQSISEDFTLSLPDID
jgi:hypothetical protein